MSGGFIPYHIRPNKSIDRHLFMELLRYVDKKKPIREYAYIGFGGNSLEDFKIIHQTFGNKYLISLEESESVYKRQLFNKPVRTIICKKLKSIDFINRLSTNKSTITWLDFADPKLIGPQINELRTLLSKLADFDVVKITLNANINCLGEAKDISEEEIIRTGKEKLEILRNRRLEKLKNRLRDHLPSTTESAKMNDEEYPKVLLDALRIATQKAFEGNSDRLFLPLSSFIYKDSLHKMLTLTGIIIPSENVSEFLQETAIDSWEFYSNDWNKIVELNAPGLTIKEKLWLDKEIPVRKFESLIKKIPFDLDEEESKHESIIKDYIKLYRYYPHFTRITL
ncbi:O-methyltransferase [Leptospira barantonii]|uniref:Uncharacterized protein n=1 Tax=Leptospira barantonii TaxID=2023184 RepID=A0ABX4NL56_9LEPT|nr:O-methyltransferase [Leptospira barantonii]PJZ57458.1 hypothetical protein CH367_08875 [Leptospira barantonii]